MRTTAVIAVTGVLISAAFSCAPSGSVGSMDDGQSGASPAGREGIYIGSARCTWVETTRGGTSQSGEYDLSLHFEIDRDGLLFDNGTELRVGAVETISFGDTVQTGTVTGFSNTSSGVTWSSDWTVSNADSDFDADVNGVIRFDSGGVTFQRSVLGVYSAGEVTIDRSEQCSGSLTR